MPSTLSLPIKLKVSRSSMAMLSRFVTGTADHTVGSNRPAGSKKHRLKNPFSSVFSNRGSA